MPSASLEEHDYWTEFGPSDSGHINAIKFLEDKGWRLTTSYRWCRPAWDHVTTEEEWRAINYLIMEWDFDGVAEGLLGADEKFQSKIKVVRSERKTYEGPRPAWRYKGILFKHKKGGLYLRLFEVRHTERVGERLTIYVHLWPHKIGGWARPVDMFDDPERFKRIV